jgi:hypothetical protein
MLHFIQLTFKKKISYCFIADVFMYTLEDVSRQNTP